MVKEIQSPTQTDEVKFWMLRALNRLFAAKPAANPKFDDPAVESRCVQALLEFLARKWDGTASSPSEEVNGFRYARREAIRALSKTRLPFELEKKDMKDEVVRPTALALLRVVRNDGIVPTASILELSEQCEAFVGVCHFPAIGGYLPDYAAYHLGLFLVDFATAYGADPSGKALAWRGWAKG